MTAGEPGVRKRHPGGIQVGVIVGLVLSLGWCGVVGWSKLGEWRARRATAMPYRGRIMRQAWFTSIPVTSSRMVSQVTYLWLPPSTRVRHGDLYGGLSPRVVAELKMTGGDLQAFLTRNRPKSLSRTERELTTADYREGRAWWNPDGVRSFVSASGYSSVTPEGVGKAAADMVWWVVADRAGGAKTTIYLVWQH